MDRALKSYRVTARYHWNEGGNRHSGKVEHTDSYIFSDDVLLDIVKARHPEGSDFDLFGFATYTEREGDYKPPKPS